MRILHISPYYPYLKAPHAGGVCMAKEIEVLRKNNEVTVLSFVQNIEEIRAYDVDKLKNKVYVVKLKAMYKFLSIISKPNKPNYFTTRSNKLFYKKMVQVMREQKITHVHAEYSSMGQYLLKIKKKFPKINTTLVLHDVTKQSYNRKTDNSKGIKRIYYKFQKKLITKYEGEYIKTADNVIVFSDKDKALVSDYYGYSSSIVVNSFFNIDGNAKLGELLIQDEVLPKHIGFLGQMSRKENEDAALKLIKIFNSIYDTLNGSKLYIIGNNPSSKLQKHASDRVVITGYVENINEYLQECKVMVFPLTEGAGIKIKVLYSMSLAIPVITSKVGSEGIDNNDTIILCETDQEYIDAIHKINSLSIDEYSVLRKRILALVKTGFTWEKTTDILNDLYSK